MANRKKKLFMIGASFLMSTIFYQSAYAATKEQNSSETYLNLKNKLLVEQFNIEPSEIGKRPISKSRPTKSSQPEQQLASYITYKVVSGDNLTKISEKFNVTIDDIVKWNQLTSPDIIYAGQILNIYSSSNEVLSQEDVISKPSQKVVVENSEKVVNDDSSKNDVTHTNQSQNDKVYKPTFEEYKQMKDQEIEQQLAKEKMIQTDPTIDGQAIYERVLEISREQIGVPYLFAGNTPNGFDCSGFVRYVYFQSGLDIERKSSEEYFMKETTKVVNPIPGDVVFFKDTYKDGISHMGIFIGDGKFIHAGDSGVEEASLEMDYWKKRFVAFKRFNGIESE